MCLDRLFLVALLTAACTDTRLPTVAPPRLPTVPTPPSPTPPTPPPAPVANLRFASIGAGHGFSCGLATDGAVYCWGYRWDQWLLGFCPDPSYYDWFPCGAPVGLPPSADSVDATPVRLGGNHSFATLSVGWRHACALTADGSAYCWGYAAYAQLGDGRGALQGTLTPIAVAGDIRFKSISAGDSHTCGVGLDGSAYCWGFGEYGQLGAGLACPSAGEDVCAAPARVAGSLSFREVSTGSASTCGLTTTGAAYCWGQNAWNALGNGTAIGPETCGGWLHDCSREPVAVGGEHTFTSIAALAYGACALDTGGTLYCWGDASTGIFGPGFTPSPSDQCATYPGQCSSTPRAVAGEQQFASLTGSFSNVCAVTTVGTAHCHSALGDEAWTTVPNLEFKMVSAGRTTHACGISIAGDAYCWGDNGVGQLGDGTRTSSTVPVKIAGQ
jgi:alpha-tubulin suppressor-like RCC1 family protein